MAGRRVGSTVVRREEYLELIRALGKLGVPIGVPERLAMSSRRQPRESRPR